MQLLCLNGLEPSLNIFVCLPGFQYFLSLCFLHKTQTKPSIKATLSTVSKYHSFSYFSCRHHSTYLCAMALWKTVSKQGKLVLPELSVGRDTDFLPGSGGSWCSSGSSCAHTAGAVHLALSVLTWHPWTEVLMTCRSPGALKKESAGGWMNNKCRIPALILLAHLRFYRCSDLFPVL